MSERERQTIPIRGINIAEPCHSVADGSMEDIYNLRFKNSAFANVCEPKILHPITNDGGYTIVHKMECLADNEYIAIKQISQSQTVVAYVEIINGNVNVKEHFASLGESKLTFYSFGNVLYINWGVGMELQENSYIYKEGKFSCFDLNEIAPPEFTIQCEHISAIGSPVTNGAAAEILTVTSDGSGGVTKEFSYNSAIFNITEAGYFVGVCSIVAAYVMTDGSVIKPSKIYCLSSYDSKFDSANGSIFRTVGSRDINRPYTGTYFGNIDGVKVTVSLIQDIPNNELIKGVRLFATRVNPLFNYEDIHEKFSEDFRIEASDRPGHADARSYCYGKRILNQEAIDLNQPFYEILDINIGESTQVELNYKDHLKDLIYGSTFKPSYSNHKTTSANKFEYNNRVHIYGIKSQLFRGNAFALPSNIDTSNKLENEDITVIFNAVLQIDNEDVIISNSSIIPSFAKRPPRPTEEELKPEYTYLPMMFTYPDTRVKNIEIIIINSLSNVLYKKTLATQNAYANNLSYAFISAKQDINTIPLYQKISLTETAEQYASKEVVKCIYCPNTLQVSAMNNPFYFDPTNIYTIGDTNCSIQAINTATEQITETKFGMFPLYVFTDKAITALEVGDGQVLYSRIVDVSGERKLQNTGTVGARNLVFFISARGVMAIEGRTVQCVSEQLDKYSGLLALDFSTYCASATLSYNPIEDELLCYNPSFEYAYIYSLKGKFWSRRYWSAQKIGAQSENFTYSKGITSAWIEDPNKPLAQCKIKSRAMKLGSLEFKRLETIVARLSTGAQSNYSIVVEGSNDLQSWIQLSSSQGNALIRRTGASCKYFRVSLTCNVRDYFSITNFDVEYYLRFVRRLR